MICALLAELLAEFGHSVVCGTATTESDAVTDAASQEPDLIIIDAHLRAGSGILAMGTFLQRCAIPHIFMTGGSRLSIPATAAVLHKPFGKASLMAALARATG